MVERLVVSAALTVALYLALERQGDEPTAFQTLRRVALLGALAWTVLGWTHAERFFPEVFPRDLAGADVGGIVFGSLLFGAAAFASALGPRGLLPGLAFGVVCSLTGACASRWPQLARGVELAGGVFVGLSAGALLTTALAATHAAVAAALVRDDWRPARGVVLASALAAWGGVTFATEAVLARVWGYGPRSLAAAAGIPTNAEAPTMTVAWLYPSRDRSWRAEKVRMSSETVDLTPPSIERLEAYLERTRFRGVFVEEALDAVRLGRAQWWDEEKALDAAMLSVPGRVHPDYRKALELLRAGPVTAERYGKLEQLSAATGRRVEGFEKGSESQLIFEGFSAAYARFGDETRAREWLGRLDGLWAVSEKKIEAGSLEDLRDGRVEGTVLLDDRPATDLRVGLFSVWKSSATGVTHYWLSGSRMPDSDGRFAFDALGPGRYVLALLGRNAEFSGSVHGAPGVFEVTYERPEVLLDPVRVSRLSRPDDLRPTSPLPPMPAAPAEIPEPQPLAVPRR